MDDEEVQNQSSPALLPEIDLHRNEHGQGEDSAVGSLDLSDDPCKVPNSMDILREFNKIFSDRLAKIDPTQSSENINQQQNRIYRDWVDHLVEQNSDLIQAVGDIEREACAKLSHLEGAVKKNDPMVQKRLTLDLSNLIEFIRRARETGKWDATGLEFYCIPAELIEGSRNKSANDQDGGLDVSVDVTTCDESRNDEHPRSVTFENETGLRSERLDVSIKTSNADPCALLDESNFSGIIAELKLTNQKQRDYLDKLSADNEELELKCKRLENELSSRTKREETFSQMNEDKLELVQEIAERQDCISKYRAEITHLEKQLEEQLEQKDFHIQFKDKIIKDLRRECKKNCLQPSNHLTQAASLDKTSHLSYTETGTATMYRVSDTEQFYSINDPSSFESLQKDSDYANPKMSSENPRSNTLQSEKLREELIAKERELSQRDETIANQKRQLCVLDSMRSLVQSCRSVYEQLSEFDQSQQNQGALHKSNSSLTLSGELTSGFYSTETIHAPQSPTQTRTSPFQSDMVFDVRRLETASPDQADLNDWNDGTTLINGIQAVMQSMCSRILSLTQETNQMNDNLVRLKEERDTLEELNEVEAGKHRMALMEMADVFSRLSETLAGDDDKPLQAKSLASIKNGDLQPIVDLADHLKSNTQAKEQQLADQDTQIQDLQSDVMRLERELFEMHKRGSLEDQERDKQRMETIDNLNMVVSAHQESLANLQAAKLAQDKEIQELQGMIQTQHKLEQTLLEKQRKLDNEFGGSSPTEVHRMHVDAQEAALAVSVLSEQLSSVFEENLTQHNYIRQLQDENLVLRAQLVECLQDFACIDEKQRQRNRDVNVNKAGNNDEDFRSLSSSSLSSVASVVNLQADHIQYSETVEKRDPPNNVINELTYKFRNLLDEMTEPKITYPDSLDQQRYNVQQIDLTANKPSSHVQIKQLEVDIKSTVGERQRYQNMLHTLQNDLKNSQSKLQEENMRLINEIKCIKLELAAATTNVDALKNELDRFRGRLQTASDVEFQLVSELNQNIETVCAISGENTRLQSELDEFRSKYEALNTTYNEIHGKMVNDWTKLRRLSEDRLTRILLHEQSIETLSKCNQQYFEKAEQMESEITNLREHNGRLREEVSELKGRESIRKPLLDRSQKDTASKLLLLNDSRRELLDYKKSNEDLLKSNDVLSVKLQQLQEEYEALRNDYRDLKVIKEQVVATLESNKSLILELRNRDQLQTEHIESLLDERNNLILKVKQTHRDLQISQQPPQHFTTTNYNEFAENDIIATGSASFPNQTQTQRIFFHSDNNSTTRTHFPISKSNDGNEYNEILQQRRIVDKLKTLQRNRKHIEDTLSSPREVADNR